MVNSIRYQIISSKSREGETTDVTGRDQDNRSQGYSKVSGTGRCDMDRCQGKRRVSSLSYTEQKTFHMMIWSSGKSDWIKVRPMFFTVKEEVLAWWRQNNFWRTDTLSVHWSEESVPYRSEIWIRCEKWLTVEKGTDSIIVVSWDLLEREERCRITN